MSVRIYEARQYVDAVAKVYYYFFSFDSSPTESTTKVGDWISAEGKTPEGAVVKLKGAIDHFCQTGVNPNSLYRTEKQILSCQPVEKPTVELKVSLAERLHSWWQRIRW